MRLNKPVDESSEIVFTPASLLDLLSQIEELNDYDIGLSEGLNDYLQLQIGSSTYEIKPKAEIELPVDEDVLLDIEDINDAAYDDIQDAATEPIDELESIESGLIKEALKTLLIGGVVRLGKKYLKE